MPFKLLKIAIVLFALLAPGLVTSGWALARLGGSAELSYIKYDAEAGGNEIFSGNSFAQRYSLNYSASNLVYRSQPRYYDLNIGYNWIGFKTKVLDLNQESNYKQSSSSFNYSGSIMYSTPGLPIRLSADIGTTQPINLTRNLVTNNLIKDDLVVAITGTDKTVTSGFQFEFEPGLARSMNVQGLPRLLVDYRETTYKSSDYFARVDSKTKELAVAGLNKENNWVHYRSLIYENNLVPLDRMTRQQIQIGLVDNLGQRRWASLTNWIEASVDGRLTQVKSPVSDRNLEEYDVNLMMIASRRTWDARTFMNYNRQLDDDSLNETARIPLYIKGSYGSDTSWYLSLGATMQKDRPLYAKTFDTVNSYTVTVGGTTFQRSSFTLSPTISLQTGKSSQGIDPYSFRASLETLSTRRFSDKLGVSGKISWRNMDDGLSTVNSKSWSTSADLRAVYNPSSYAGYTVADTIELGSGSGYLSAERSIMNDSGAGRPSDYFRNFTQVTARWTPTERFSTSLDGEYDIVMSDVPKSDVLSISYKAIYRNNITTLTYDSRFRRIDNGVGEPFISWLNTADITSRPDRYSDGTFRLSHSLEGGTNSTVSRLEVLQRYNYKFFTRNGINRILATLSEEYSYSRLAYNSAYSPSGQYLQLLGRYNPTERISLYGSVKYQKSSGGTVAMIYNAGMNADFKLLSTGLDYTYAKRDSDNRLEKKFAASVRRSF